MNTFKVGDQVVLVKDVYDLVDNTDSYGYTFKLGDSFEVVNLMSMPNDKWIVKGKVCLEDLEGLEEFFVVKAKEEIKKSALQFKVGDLVRIKEDFETPTGLAEENIYCVEQLSGMGSLSVVGKAGWFAEKYFELFAQPINQPQFKSITIETKQEQVHSPKHYSVLEDIEAIQIIASSMTQEMFKGYCLGNILKYRLRCGAKDDVTQELAKADKYKELFAKYKHMCKGEK